MATSDDHLPGMRLVQASLAALREALIEAASESIGSSDQHIWMMVMGRGCALARDANVVTPNSEALEPRF